MSHEDSCNVSTSFNMSAFMPLMSSSFEPGKAKRVAASAKDPTVSLVMSAELAYFSGNASAAAHIAETLLSHTNSAARFSGCLIYAYANLTLGRPAQARRALAEIERALQASRAVTGGEASVGRGEGRTRAAGNEAPVDDPNAAGTATPADGPNTTDAANPAANPNTTGTETSAENTRAALTILANFMGSTLLHCPSQNSMPLSANHMALLPPGLRLFALYTYAHQLYLAGEYARSLGVVETAFMTQANVYPIPAIYLHLAATMDCMALRDTPHAQQHLLAAWALAQPDGFLEPFGEHHGLVGGLIESTLKAQWPEEFKRVIDIAYKFSDGWIAVHNPETGDTVADNLTTTEFAVSMLAARGWSNKEIGAHLGVSANTVKGHLSCAFAKLGITSRKELPQHLLK